VYTSHYTSNRSLQLRSAYTLPGIDGYLIPKQVVKEKSCRKEKIKRETRVNQLYTFYCVEKLKIEVAPGKIRPAKLRVKEQTGRYLYGAFGLETAARNSWSIPAYKIEKNSRDDTILEGPLSIRQIGLKEQRTVINI
jgi:hypothetical protein